jgi:hypothetical protein
VDADIGRVGGGEGEDQLGYTVKYWSLRNVEVSYRPIVDEVLEDGFFFVFAYSVKLLAASSYTSQT